MIGRALMALFLLGCLGYVLQELWRAVQENHRRGMAAIHSGTSRAARVPEQRR